MDAPRLPLSPQICTLIRLIWRINVTYLLLWTALAASGQETAAVVRVTTIPPNLSFRVDGQHFQGAASFAWPTGSKHVLTADPMLDGLLARTRFRFAGWQVDETQLQQDGASLIVTADPAIKSYVARFTTEYMVSLGYFTCGEGGPCESPGSVLVDGERYSQSADIWKAAGSTMLLEAVPNPGFVFLGWQPGANAPTAFMTSIVVNQPLSVTPRFAPARQVRLETSPPGLELLVDRTPAGTPARYDWGLNTTHTLSPVSPQYDRTGRLWVFQKWSDGVTAALRPYQVAMQSVEAVLTAEYVPGARASFTTSPPGLRLHVDGRDNWYSYTFGWGVGETHRVEAPAEQTDQNGRKWVFLGWSNGGAAVQDVSITDAHAADGLRLTAEYELLGRLTVQASAGGVTAVVDGAECPLPCTVHRRAGTEVRIAVPAAAPAGEGSRLQFQGWGDADSPERAVTFDSEARIVTASYRLMHRLAMASDPPQGAAWRCAPESPDGFYGAETSVLVRIEARPGYRFRRFEGDLNGGGSAATLAMNGPKFVRAVFDRVPYVAPAGVANAAGETPVAAVAPGSVISIYGANLATDVEIGPDSPLAQAIAGVTVRTGDRMLPLFYVSPEQINAQLPSDVEPGEYSLTVKPGTGAEVKTNFTVARNAPGLFQTVFEDKAWAVASHADGSAVTEESPARRGETITIYGTGFGPYDRPTPDGFAVPEAPVYKLADPAAIVAGETVFQPQWAGAAPGRVGIAAFKVLVGPELPSGAVLLKLRVNEQESNSVLLAVE